MPTTSPVLVARTEAVAVITLNRPAQRNALNRALKEALLEALRTAADDAAVRAIVLTGAGGAFSVGQDLGEHAAALEGGGEAAFDTVAEHYNPIVDAIATAPKPVIAAVGGACVGAALGFALAADIRVFAETAKLGTAFAGIGLAGDSGLTASLSREVGPGRAKELFLLAETFTPAEAIAWGIAGRVVPDGEVLEVATVLADRLAAGPTRAYAEVKTLIRELPGRGLTEGLEAERMAARRLAGTEDHRGAVRAFLSKERPTFTGR